MKEVLCERPSVETGVGMFRQENKFILDATAGFRMMWFNKRHPNCIYLDQRPECEPDIVGDFRDLKQFPDETFKMIVFDPPFWKGNSHANLWVRQYGLLNAETWQSDLKQGVKELWRILKPYGVLFGKWSNYQIPSTEFLKLFPVDPLVYQVTAAYGLKAKKRASDEEKLSTRHIEEKVKTLWFCFMKIPEQKETNP